MGTWYTGVENVFDLHGPTQAFACPECPAVALWTPFSGSTDRAPLGCTRCAVGDISSPVSCIDDIDLNMVADFCDLFAQASARFSGDWPYSSTWRRQHYTARLLHHLVAVYTLSRGKSIVPAVLESLHFWRHYWWSYTSDNNSNRCRAVVVGPA